MAEEGQYLYGGLSGVALRSDSFDLGKGITLKRTYAHLMSPCLMAFSRPGPAGHHPPPWKAARGGFGFDIEIELRVPKIPVLRGVESRETIWWIAALLRIGQVPFLTVPVISDHSFETARDTKTEPNIEPFETEPRILKPAEGGITRELTSEVLDWVKLKWAESGGLLHANSGFYSAMKAFDAATVRGNISSSLLSLWGGLEQIFSPSPGELRFRVASMLASYLEPQGESRLDLYKRILTLYNERSVAAHTAKEMETGPLVETYVLMRNALVRMIDENAVPTQQDLEARLFGC